MKVLVVNPGATSTKVSIFDEEEEVFKKGINHSADEMNRFERIYDQVDYRLNAILETVKESGFALESFNAVCGRGGLYEAIPSGTYLVNDKVMKCVEEAPFGEHAASLGAYLAKKIADMIHVPAYFVDPVCVDEMTDVAHYSGFAGFSRVCMFHALNHKSIARRAAKELGKPYESLNLIVCHLGGGVSVGAHEKGRVVDVFNVKEEGSMGLDRGGGLPVNKIIDYCYSGLSKQEIKKILGRKSGMFSYVGTTDFREICQKVKEGDAKFKAAYDALVYQLAKDIGAMAVVLKMDVDAIVFTGGMAYDDMFCKDIGSYVKKIAPILRIPGEEEMRSLAEGALRVLHGEQEARIY